MRSGCKQRVRRLALNRSEGMPPARCHGPRNCFANLLVILKATPFPLPLLRLAVRMADTVERTLSPVENSGAPLYPISTEAL